MLKCGRASTFTAHRGQNWEDRGPTQYLPPPMGKTEKNCVLDYNASTTEASRVQNCFTTCSRTGKFVDITDDQWGEEEIICTVLLLRTFSDL